MDAHQHCGLLGDIRSRTTLAFRLMPRMSATIDCKAVAEAGHTLAKGYGPISVKTFLETLAAAELAPGNNLDSNTVRFSTFLLFSSLL